MCAVCTNKITLRVPRQKRTLSVYKIGYPLFLCRLFFMCAVYNVAYKMTKVDSTKSSKHASRLIREAVGGSELAKALI